MLLPLFLLMTAQQSRAEATAAPAVVAAMPAPSSDPLEIDPRTDPILAQGDDQMGSAMFLEMVKTSVGRHPAMAEMAAGEEQARAGKRVARSGLFPTVELEVTGDRSISRNFGDNVSTIVERSRLDGRTDAVASVQQTLFDFGATFHQIESAKARFVAAEARTDDVSQRVAYLAVAAYYDLFTFQQLVALTRSFQERQAAIRAATEEHIRAGTSARGDLSRVDASIARVSAQLANFARRLADAEARWSELSGLPVPASVRRPAPVGATIVSKDAAIAQASAIPAVRAAEQDARAERQDARTQRARLFPTVTAQVTAARYGILENISDYDARASLSVRQRLFGGALARADEASAQASAAEARAQRMREESERDAAIAWSDLAALDAQLSAQRDNYLAARRVRDVEAERFRVERGTLVDNLDAEETYYGVASAYLNTLSQRDVARFTLLVRSGKLGDALGLDAPGTGRFARGRE